jgi:hypothetical protein
MFGEDLDLLKEYCNCIEGKTFSRIFKELRPVKSSSGATETKVVITEYSNSPQVAFRQLKIQIEVQA